eukprot:4924290-Prymnesium_polylepis.3
MRALQVNVLAPQWSRAVTGESNSEGAPRTVVEQGQQPHGHGGLLLASGGARVGEDIFDHRRVDGHVALQRPGGKRPHAAVNGESKARRMACVAGTGWRRGER